MSIGSKWGALHLYLKILIRVVLSFRPERSGVEKSTWDQVTFVDLGQAFGAGWVSNA